MTIKQVIVVRTDLEMGKGKIAGQVGHAAHLLTAAAYESAESTPPSNAWIWYDEWMKTLYRKVVLKADSEAELFRIFGDATKAGLPTIVVHDAGLTQLKSNTVTCVGIGPCPGELIDAITGNLKLL